MKLSEEQKRKIVLLHREHGVSQANLATRFGVSRTIIYRILGDAKERDE